MQIEITLLIAIIGGFVGLAGWLSGRDRKISNDSEWKGAVKQQLDNIQDGVVGTQAAIAEIKGDVNAHSDRIARLEEVAERVDVIQEHGERITAVEESAKQAHHRITDHINNNK